MAKAREVALPLIADLRACQRLCLLYQDELAKLDGLRSVLVLLIEEAEADEKRLLAELGEEANGG